MKRRILSLVLALIMILGCLTACLPQSTPPDDGGGGKGPDSGGSGSGGSGSGGSGSGGSGSGGDGSFVFLDAAELEAAKTRLENADLSLNFAINASDGSSPEPAVYQPSTPGAHSFTATPEELIEGRFFENPVSGNEWLAQKARDTADWFIENVYALDVAIIWGGATAYYMHHDKETDALSVESIQLGNGQDVPTEYMKIVIRYDSKGNEVIEMTNVSDTTLSKAVYCKDNYYSYSGVMGIKGEKFSISTSGELVDYYVWSSSAYKENGLWRGTAFNIASDQSIFADVGSQYKDCNEGIDVSSFVETEEGFANFSNHLEPRRADGSKVCGWDEVLGAEDNLKRADDIYKYYTNAVSLYNSVINSSYDAESPCSMSFGLDAFDGWDSVVLDAKLSVEDAYGNYYWSYIDSENDINDIYITVDGRKIPIYGGYTKTHGFLKYIGMDNGYEQFERLSDGAIISKEQINSSEFFFISPIVDFKSDEYGNCTDDIRSVTLGFGFDNGAFRNTQEGYYIFSKEKIMEYNLQTLEPFLDEFGLTDSAREISHPRFVVNLFNDGNNITTDIIHHSYGFKPTADAFRSYILGFLQEGKDLYETGIADILDGYRKENFSEEKMNAYKQLGAALVEIEGNLNGAVSASESGIDFSSLSVTLNRSTMLSASKKYGVAVTFLASNPDAFLPVYDSQSYENTGIVWGGGLSYALPEKLTEGSYVLSAYYIRENDDGTSARISEIAAIPTAQFEPFEVEYETGDLTYIAKYSCSNGELLLYVDIKDVEPPEIVLNGMAFDEDTNTITYRFEASKKKTVKDLLEALDIFDRVDGAIYATTENIKINGASVSGSKNLIPGETYTVTVSDIRGNAASVNILIATYEADKSDKTAPVFTSDLEYSSSRGAYVYSYEDTYSKSVADLFGIVSANDAVCGYIPIELENITLDGAAVSISDTLENGKTYVITVEDYNLNVATVKIYIDIYTEE